MLLYCPLYYSGMVLSFALIRLVVFFISIFIQMKFKRKTFFGKFYFSNLVICWCKKSIKASLTFKCMTEHLFADFSYSVALDTYLWKQMMQMNRKLIHIWYNVDKKHLLFTKRKCHGFSWLFTASRCSPRRRSICACRIACKVLVSIGLHSLSFGFLKKGFLLGKPCL